MSEAEQTRQAARLRRVFDANVACGDVGEAEQARMLALIAAAEGKNRPEERSAA